MRSALPGLLAVLLLVPTGAAVPSDTPLVLAPQSRLWVEGTSTVRAFTCRASALEAELAGTPDAVAAVLAGEKAVHRVEFRVPAARMECGNGTMNAHMLKALKATEHRTIVFRVASYDLGPAPGGVTGTLTGTLTLGGAERPITVEASGRGEGGALRVTGAYQLRMSDYGLKAPTLMLGTLKVHDAVKVGFDLVLQAEPRISSTH